MNIQQFIKQTVQGLIKSYRKYLNTVIINRLIRQIAQGQYEPFRQYLNTGKNGGPVTKLNLSNSFENIPNKTALLEHLFEALKTNTTLTTLYLRHNYFGNEGAAVIAQALKTNTTLTTLDLHQNNIGLDGVAAIAQALETNATLTALNLSVANIGPEGAAAIAQALKTNTTLTSLCMMISRIRPEGAAAIAEALKTNTTLTTLNIGNNHIDNEGAAAIAEALKTNTTLTSLNLGCNDIGNEGAADIAEALKTNTTLTKLELMANHIGNKGAAAITQALKTNAKLATLDLRWCNLTQEGVTAILSQIPLYSALSAVVFDDMGIVNANNINDILITLSNEKNALDVVDSVLPHPITEAFAQHFTRINNEAAHNLLVDPNNDFSRGLTYVKHRRLAGQTVKEAAPNTTPALNDSQEDTPQAFVTGKRNKEQDNSAKRPRTRYQNINKREAEEIKKEAEVFCGEIKDESKGKRRRLRVRK